MRYLFSIEMLITLCKIKVNFFHSFLFVREMFFQKLFEFYFGII